ncbi:MAG: acetate--CoA ligase family protein [Thermoplasmata archaeon]
MPPDTSNSDTITIVEHDAKNLLAKAGIKVPRGIETREFPPEIELTFPVALKVSDPRILHKTDVGGVKLNLGKAELGGEFMAMKKKFPESSFLIEEMQPQGVEFIIGVVKDASFGYVIMLGTGGIYTELYHDITFRKIPINLADASEMINDIRSGIFCDGFRGIQVNCNALKNTLISISNMTVEGNHDILSMDLNPVIVTKEDAVVVDAKISLRSREFRILSFRGER